MKEQTIFPDLLIENKEQGNLKGKSVTTSIRIKHTNGKYYLQQFYRSSVGYEEDKSHHLEYCIKHIIEDVYTAMHLSVVDPEFEMVPFGGEDKIKVYILDPDQTDEKERMKAIHDSRFPSFKD